MTHSRWKLARERKLVEGYSEPAEVVAERVQIRLAMALRQAVHDRRKALGLSETALADRMGITAEEVEGIELGDVGSFCWDGFLPML